MGFVHFQKGKRACDGLDINLSKSGIGLSAGVKPQTTSSSSDLFTLKLVAVCGLILLLAIWLLAQIGRQMTSSTSPGQVDLQSPVPYNLPQASQGTTQQAPPPKVYVFTNPSAKEKESSAATLRHSDSSTYRSGYSMPSFSSYDDDYDDESIHVGSHYSYSKEFPSSPAPKARGDTITVAPSVPHEPVHSSPPPQGPRNPPASEARPARTHVSILTSP